MTQGVKHLAHIRSFSMSILYDEHTGILKVESKCLDAIDDLPVDDDYRESVDLLKEKLLKDYLSGSDLNSDQYIESFGDYATKIFEVSVV